MTVEIAITGSDFRDKIVHLSGEGSFDREQLALFIGRLLDAPPALRADPRFIGMYQPQEPNIERGW